MIGGAAFKTNEEMFGTIGLLPKNLSSVHLQMDGQARVSMGSQHSCIIPS